MSSLAKVFLFSSLYLLVAPTHAATFYVDPNGADNNDGTESKPFATLTKAQTVARALAGKEAVTVNLLGGTHYLGDTLVFTPADSGSKTAPVIYQAAPGEKPVVSGGIKLDLKWEPYKDGIYQAKVPDDLKTEEIFINGDRQILARYPDFNPQAKYFDGFAKDALSKERATRWADPSGGYFHAMHPALWGDFTWIITGKDSNGEVTKEGGWQNNRGGAIHNDIRFVENIFEELDAPGEWFLNQRTHTLYFYPPAGLDLKTAMVEATRLRCLVEFKGDEKNPVRFVSLKELTFRHAARTVMDTKEALLRTDWAIYRGGAIFFNGAEDCTLEDALIDQVGGNAVFVNNYNRRITIRGCEISKAGASGICFVGDQKSVRSPLFNYDQVNKLENIDLTPGPLTNNYPADCLVEDCLIYLTGRVEKQTAGVEIDIAQDITVRHCSIYDMPRSGINIGDGCFGGHVIEFCDIFDTVKETGDHGSFNSWGRDRFWRPNTSETDAWVKKVPQLPLLDVVKPITLNNNRWRCEHGWDIDLDDGSSNYIITNNLCLNGGIKNREGYRRVVENNILVNNQFHPHCWYVESADIFRRNILQIDNYSDARMHPKPWGAEMDYNLVSVQGKTDPSPAKGLQAKSGRDEHSIIVDAQFVDPENGDYQVKEGSPALALGFKNFPLDQFGVQKASLKAKSRTPVFGKARAEGPKRDSRVQNWLGAKVRNIVGQSEMSAYGTAGESGILVLEIPAGNPLLAAGFQKDDVIVSVDGKRLNQYTDLAKATAGWKIGQEVQVGILRTQKESSISLKITPDLPVSLAPVVPQSSDGSVVLNASDAEVVGQTAFLEGANIGNWKNVEDIVRWQVAVMKPGPVGVVLNYALANGSGNSEFELSADGQTLTGKLATTGGWGNYQTLNLGVLNLSKTGVLLVTIKPTKKPGEAVMNLRGISMNSR